MNVQRDKMSIVRCATCLGLVVTINNSEAFKMSPIHPFVSWEFIYRALKVQRTEENFTDPRFLER